MRESLRTCLDTGWLDANGEIEDMLSHEFGHQVEHWLLSNNGKAFSRYMAADGTGNVADTVRLFNKANKPTKALSQYATTTNSIKTTRYQQWVDDRVEGCAEGFSAIQTKPRSQWPVYVRRLDTLIEEVGDTSKWIDVGDAVYIGDLRRDPVEFERAKDTINAIRERLNL